jgi:hypothetical protein
MNAQNLTVSPTACALLAGIFLGIVGARLGPRVHLIWLQLLHLRNNQVVIAQARASFSRRAKGRIIKTGRIVLGPDGREHPIDFEIACPRHVPVESYGPDGEFCRGGWTHAELLEIARRGKEFA